MLVQAVLLRDPYLNERWQQDTHHPRIVARSLNWGAACKTLMIFQAILYVICHYSLIHSDEGLTLETSVFESFTVANIPYRPCG